jgi:hypothetical protein
MSWGQGSNSNTVRYTNAINKLCRRRSFKHLCLSFPSRNALPSQPGRRCGVLHSCLRRPQRSQLMSAENQRSPWGFFIACRHAHLLSHASWIHRYTSSRDLSFFYFTLILHFTDLIALSTLHSTNHMLIYNAWPDGGIKT